MCNFIMPMYLSYPIAPESRENIVQMQRDLQSEDASFVPVCSEDLHVTLFYLGKEEEWQRIVPGGT